jgi:Response regulators consisting of a CheY-like receiver domain and a winged-helix DNA-binding domain
MPQILIIDDDSIIQTVLKKALQSQGYEVAIADDGETGLALAEKLRPALIVSDWVMPGLDGLEVCRRVKANPNLSTTFFILLTAQSAVEDRIQGLDTGADDFLAKPIEINELQARVRAGLRLHALSEDLQAQKRLLEKELSEAASYVRSLLPAP